MKQEQTSLEDWKTSKCGCGLCIYCCIRKEVNKSLADQKAKIRKLFNKHITCSCGWDEQVTKKLNNRHQFLKEFEEL